MSGGGKGPLGVRAATDGQETVRLGLRVATCGCGARGGPDTAYRYRPPSPWSCTLELYTPAMYHAYS